MNNTYQEQQYYSISEVSDILNLTYRTLRYYEEKFSLQINRNSSGERIYREKDIKLFETIKKLRANGMKLEGIKSFLLEKGIIKQPTGDLSPVEIMEYQRSLLKQEIREVIYEQFNEIKSCLDKMTEEYMSLKETVNLHMRTTDEHYKKIDEYITNWRNRKKQSWLKRLFSN